MSSPIYVVSYDSRLFPAHWALWVPRLDDARLGKIIDVTGDPRQGFEHRIVRNEPLSEPNQRHTVHLLGHVSNHLVDDGVLSGAAEVVDKHPLDGIEEHALRVPPPAKCLRDAAAQAAAARVEICNCQTWLSDVVGKLVDDGILPSDALETIKRVPKN